jgi:hypothetical protein
MSVLHHKIAHYSHILLICVEASSLSACAINQYGSAKLKLYENNTGYVAVLETWGVALNTMPSTSGLNFGLAKQIYIYNKTASSPTRAFSENGLANLDISQFDVIGNVQNSSSQDILGRIPLAVSRKDYGLSLDFNESRIGIHAGISTSQRISLPDSFQGIFLLMLDSENPEHAKIHIEEGAPQ